MCSTHAAAMMEARSARRRAEADVKLLKNRINHLKREEKKAVEKIQETKTRANQIISLKKRNESKSKEKNVTASLKLGQLW